MGNKDLNKLIQELLEIQAEGKGHYKVRESDCGETLTFTVHDDFEDIFFG